MGKLKSPFGLHSSTALCGAVASRDASKMLDTRRLVASFLRRGLVGYTNVGKSAAGTLIPSSE